MDKNENEGDTLRELEKLQNVISISANRLIGFRTQCEVNAELTQQEIRTLEGKLIKLFAKLIVKREQLNKKSRITHIQTDQVLERWLQVVDLSPKTIRGLCERIRSIESLLECSEQELKRIMREDDEDGVQRLVRALRILKRLIENARAGVDVLDWKNIRFSPKVTRNQCGTNAYVHCNDDDDTFQNFRGSSPSGDNFITKSRSQECQLNPPELNGDSLLAKRSRLPTEPGPNSTFSPIHSPPYIQEPNDNTIQPPRSPRTPTFQRGFVTMAHTINHRFTKTFKMMSTCNYCEKNLVLGTGLKCTECQYICHKECEAKVPPDCQLPNELLFELRQESYSPLCGRSVWATPFGRQQPLKRVYAGQNNFNSSAAFPHGADSSSASSCNSSAPSSPALLPHNTPSSSSSTVSQFNYPEPISSSASTLSSNNNSATICNQSIPTPQPVQPAVQQLIETRDSDRTVVSVEGSTSTDSDRTPKRVDSQDSQVSDYEQESRDWPRQNSLSMREWDIPFDEVKLYEYIGSGRFGKVVRGNWHGDVAVKLLNMNYIEDAKRLDAFKNDVATFRKTRHDNMVLFIGACVRSEEFAIITSLCKGMTLYRHIHVLKEKFGLNKNISIAQQISQGMGYLHARGIVHKDLKSKNIFLECGNKVVITDFGLFGVTKLCYSHRQDRDGLIIPPGWLCYLSSEIMTSLRSKYQPNEELPFSKASDVYAFGTVWFELLCGDWPFRGQPPEAIIWQIGKGMKQSLANLQASRDVKDILMSCWAYRPADRPKFSALYTVLDKLPKKRLARSPSHPIHLSRSAESVF